MRCGRVCGAAGFAVRQGTEPAMVTVSGHRVPAVCALCAARTRAARGMSCWSVWLGMCETG